MKHLLLVVCAIFIAGCASAPRATQPEPPVPAYLELQAERASSTFHFRRGLYSLDTIDRDGFYYRATRGIVRHNFGASTIERGGIFIPRADRTQLRGYVLWAGGRTRLGRLSPVPHVFHD